MRLARINFPSFDFSFSTTAGTVFFVMTSDKAVWNGEKTFGEAPK